MSYPSGTWAPSDMVDVFSIGSPVSQTASTTYNLLSGIDASKYEYLLVSAVTNTVGAALTITAKESDTLTVSGGSYAAISGKTMTFAASGGDNKIDAMEIRCHGLKRYVDIQIASGAAVNTRSVTVYGFGIQDTARLTAFTTAATVLTTAAT